MRRLPDGDAVKSRERDLVQVRPLKYWQIPCAVISEQRAFTDSPTRRYLRAEGYEGSWLRRKIVRFLILITTCLLLAVFIHAEIALEIGGGLAILLGRRSPGTAPPLSCANLLLKKFRANVIPMFLTPEQKLRKAEVGSKYEKALGRALRKKTSEYVFLALVFTDSVVQGRGYATALTKSFNDMADGADKNAWLLSSDERNDTFYNAVGFITVEKWTVGENNPRWREKPVTLSLMVREVTKAVSES